MTRLAAVEPRGLRKVEVDRHLRQPDLVDPNIAVIKRVQHGPTDNPFQHVGGVLVDLVVQPSQFDSQGVALFVDFGELSVELPANCFQTGPIVVGRGDLFGQLRNPIGKALDSLLRGVQFLFARAAADLQTQFADGGRLIRFDKFATANQLLLATLGLVDELGKFMEQDPAGLNRLVGTGIVLDCLGSFVERRRSRLERREIAAGCLKSIVFVCDQAPELIDYLLGNGLALELADFVVVGFHPLGKLVVQHVPPGLNDLRFFLAVGQLPPLPLAVVILGRHPQRGQHHHQRTCAEDDVHHFVITPSLFCRGHM